MIVTSKNHLPIKEWFSFRIQSRKGEARTLLCSRRLLHQFIVDGFTMIEAKRLNWLIRNQSKLRVSKYHRLSNKTANDGQISQQKKVSGLFFHLPLLEAEDIWISCILMVWLYLAMLVFQTYLSHSLAIQTGQKFKGVSSRIT